MKTIARFLLVFCVLLTPTITHAQKKLTTGEAKDHAGETATVCGKVVSSHYAGNSKGTPTFLNLDEPYPREVFTIVIWGENLSKFGNPESKYRDKDACVTGLIKIYRGMPEVVASEPSQIEIQK
jgi:hypothetical protein